MKILITFPPSSNSIQADTGINRQTSTAIYLLGEILRNNGYDVKILDPVLYFNESFPFMSEKFIEEYFFDVDIVAISSNSFNWPYAKELIKIIKERYKDMPVILGGVHSTMLDTYVLETTEANVVCRKEGEVILPQLIKSIVLKGVRNLHDQKGVTFKDELGKIIRNPNANVLTEIEYNNIILPNYSEMPEGFYLGISCETSRGCLYNCAFCGIMHPKSWKCLTDINTQRQIDNAIYWVKQKCASPMIFIGDDCISVKADRLENLFSYLNEKKESIHVFMEGRLGDLDSLIVRETFPSHIVKRFLIGIESGYDEGLKLVRKGYTVSDVIEKVKKFKGQKMLDSMFCTFIIGLPWEGFAECLKTIQFAAFLYREYGIRSNIGWWSLVPSYLWSVKNDYNINVGPEMFDQPNWCRVDIQNKNSTFLKTHPKLSGRDVEKLRNIINLYTRSGIKIMDE